MAMTMTGEVQLAAPREVVWGKLNDPEVLKACIPGCEELEKTDDNGFRAVAKMKVGQKIAFDVNEGHGVPEITALRKR